MNESDLARRFERRNGFELIDYSEVALPLYRLTVEVITMVHHKIPPIKEFIMRSAAAGFDNAADIGGFLGLDAQTTEATLRTAKDERYLAAGEGDGVTLLDRGREVLAKECESAPQDEMLIVLFDGILRKPVWLGSEPLYSPSQINPRSTIEVRPYPATPPETSDLSIVDVSQVLHKQYGGKADFGKDILAIKRISRRQRLFRRGLALVYRKLRSSDIQIAFIIDDARNELLEHTFAERGGPRKMGFVKALDESNDMPALRRHLGTEITRLLPDAAELEERRLKVSTAYLKLSAAMRNGAREIGSGEDLMARTLEAVNLAEEELRSFSARPASVYELPILLDKALEAASQRILISTRQVEDEILNAARLKLLAIALKRGVQITIRLTETAPVGRGRKFSAIAELGKFQRAHPNLQVAVSAQPVKIYHLVKDSDFALVCNRPMFGTGGKVKSFSHFSGFLLQAPELVDAYAQRIQDAQRRGAVGRS